MRLSIYFFISLVAITFYSCSKSGSTENTRFEIYLEDEAGNNFSGATVHLYKNNSDPGVTQISDNYGMAYFSNLDASIIYLYYAEKGCKTNRSGLVAQPLHLAPNGLIHIASTMSETGTLKINNNSTESYYVSFPQDSIPVVGNSTYNYYPKVGQYTFHIDKINNPGIGKDTLIQIACGVINIINIP